MDVLKYLSLLILLSVSLLFNSGCTALQTYPTAARAGDTITMGLGYDFLMERKLMSRADTVVTLEKDDLTYTVVPPLRAVLQLYPDPNSKIANYSGFWLSTSALDGNPFETVVAFDLPTDIPAGNYNVTVTSPHLYAAFTQTLEVIPGTGSSNPFTDNGYIDRDITDLERAPTVTVALDSGYTVGAVSMVIDFDETLVSPSDINVQLPRYVFGAGNFQSTQRMMQWSDDGLQLTVNIICLNGVDSTRLNFDILYPDGSPDPLFNIVSQKVFDVDGNELLGVGATLN